MPALSASVKRSEKYAIGGVATVLAWPTFLADGSPNATYTFATDGQVTAITLDSNGSTPFLLESEVETASFSDNVQIGVNRFPKPTVGLKFNGRSDGLNKALMALDLSRHTFCLKLQSGKIVLVGGENGLVAEKSESGAGATAPDFFGYDLVVSGAEVTRAPTVALSVFQGLLTDVNLTAPITG